MYSGFITSKILAPGMGVHQRFNAQAYRMIESYLTPGTFPALGQILHFEGINGPDGLKVKQPNEPHPSHLYDPDTEEGDILSLIAKHYEGLVIALKAQDSVRTAFEASWLAHYVCDGMTPAHHFPLDKHIAAHGLRKNKRGSYSLIRTGDTMLNTVRKGWAVLGGKGLLTTHFNFEIGVATALVGQKIKVSLDAAKLADAGTIGYLEFFKKEAKEMAELEMYQRFYKWGWTPRLAQLVKTRLAPESVQAIGIIWLLAYFEAGKDQLKESIES